MKTGKLHWSLTLVVAAMLLFAHRSQAFCTNYVADIQIAVGTAAGLVAGAYHDLTNNPAPTPVQKRQAAAIARALTDLSKPAATPAVAYKFFVAAAQHLGTLALQPPFGTVGSNVFNVFTNEAQAEINCTWDRIALLSDFVKTKKSASNQLAAAQATLNSINSLSDPRLALLVAKVVFSKIVAANKLATTGEAHPGFATSSLVGKTLHHSGRNDNGGDIVFNNNVDATSTETGGSPEPITYSYTRTGLSTAALVLHEGGGETTVKARFTSTSSGTYTARHVNTDNSVENGSGTFTLTE